MEHLKPLNKLLVANRGEIAIRIFRAASELKIRTVAIYTYEDRYSLHRFKADEAYQIGKDDEPLRPYLDVEEIIALAKQQEEKEKQKEESEEERQKDSLKKKQEERKKLEKERKEKALKNIIVDGQFVSNQLGEYKINVEIFNGNKDLELQKVVIVVSYFDTQGEVIAKEEKVLEKLSAEQATSLEVVKKINAARFSCKVKDAELPPLPEE